MVLTNAERQRRYKERLKAAAASSTGFTEAMAAFLASHRAMIDDLDSQIADLESGAIRFLRGNLDATAEALAYAKRQRQGLQEIVDKHDPAGATADD